MILPIENKTSFLRFCSRCPCTKLQKSAPSLVLPERVPQSKLMHRGTAFFALRSCRVHVCSWIQLPPYLCRWFWKIGLCRRTSGWYALLLKSLLPATGQVMGFTLETGIFCLVPDRKIPVGYCFDCCCVIFCTSSPGYEPGGEMPEEAEDRRRGLLKIVCSQEKALSISNAPWSDSTSVWKPILRNWMPLSFLSSTSACYWDPEATFLRHQSYYPECSFRGEYIAFSGPGGVFIMSWSLPQLPSPSSPKNPKIIVACDCPCDILVAVETPPRSIMALSYIAQALVVTIVGLNMGFRWCVGVSYMRGVRGEGANRYKNVK